MKKLLYLVMLVVVFHSGLQLLSPRIVHAADNEPCKINPADKNPTGLTVAQPDGSVKCMSINGNGASTVLSTPTPTPSNTGVQAQNTVALDCATMKSQNIINPNGWLASLCTGPANESAVVSIVNGVINFLMFLATVIFGIMVAAGFMQVMAGGASPESLKAGKRRITLALSSVVLLYSGKIIFDLIGLTSPNNILLRNSSLSLNDLSDPTKFTQNWIFILLGTILNYVLFASGILSVAMIVYGGVKLMTSAGNPTGIQAARKIITYAVIGLAGTLAATAIINIVAEVVK